MSSRRWLVALPLALAACKSTPRITAERTAHTRVETHVRLANPLVRGVFAPPAPVVTKEDVEERPECEPGQRKLCGPPYISIPRPEGHETLRLRMTCRRMGDGKLHFDRSECATPLVVAWDGEPVVFTRPEATGAASFRIGPFDRTEWPSARSPWLALDRDGSGCIEREEELFTGFAALAPLDANADGLLDAMDPAFTELVLWSDADGDRRCTAGELRDVASAGIQAFEVDHVLGPLDRPGGSHEGERAGVRLARSAAARSARLVDAYVAPLAEAVTD